MHESIHRNTPQRYRFSMLLMTFRWFYNDWFYNACSNSCFTKCKIIISQKLKNKGKLLLETSSQKKLYLILQMGFPGDSVLKNPPANVGDVDLLPELGRTLEPEMPHNSILAWRIPRTAESGELQSMQLQGLDMTE